MLHIFKQSNNTFEGQFPDEKTILVLRAHWFEIANKIGLILVLAIAPFLIYAFGQSFFSSWDGTMLFWLVVSVYLMFLWLRLFYAIFIYILNVWIVTDHRIVESEQHGFFNRSVSEVNIANVQDVSVTIKGFYATTMNFGDLEVQSAAEEEKFLFDNVPDPLKAKDAIMQAHNDFLVSHLNKKEPLV